MSINKLKYFFAVDTTYVMKKLGVLVFPYVHQVKKKKVVLKRVTSLIFIARVVGKKIIAVLK